MKRRHFLQAAGALGLTVFAPTSTRKAGAAPLFYNGPLFVQIHAGGGWDPTSFCDPKGGAPMDPKSVNQNYTPQQIGMAGPFSYAPLAWAINGTEVYSNKRFFETHQSRLCVINGLDTTTNNHDSGERTTWCGQTSEGYPSFAAIVAGTVNQTMALPMPYLSYGGYDVTEGLVPLTRAGNVGSLQRVAYPNRTNPTDQKSSTYLSSDTEARILKAQQERTQALQGGALPYANRSLASLYLARSSDDGVAALAEKLSGLKIVQASDFADIAPVAGNLGGLTNLMQQAQLATVAFSAGVAVSVNLSIGGFDTHSNHDQAQTQSLMTLFRGVDYLVSQLQAAGILDRTVIMIGSDFGRTPYYNQGNGKDHWNITSMMFMGAGVPGGHLVGASDASFKAKTVDPFTLAAQEDPNAGKRIERGRSRSFSQRQSGALGGANRDRDECRARALAHARARAGRSARRAHAAFRASARDEEHEAFFAA